jgi:hypothetical protein
VLVRAVALAFLARTGLRRGEFLEMHRRMPGNSYCARPVGPDCHFESICESCVDVQTTLDFRPPLKRQRDDAAAKDRCPPADARRAARPARRPSESLMTAPPPRLALFEVAANPNPDSTLPFLIRLSLPGGELAFKARDSWPRTAKAYSTAPRTAGPSTRRSSSGYRSAPASGAGWRST